MLPSHPHPARRRRSIGIVVALVLSALASTSASSPVAAYEPSIDPERDLAVDPITGNVVVAAGEEIRVHEPDGDVVASHGSLDEARWVTLLGPTAYVLVGDSRIEGVDIATGDAVGSWSVDARRQGTIGAADGRIWFVSDDPSGALKALDPATGAVESTTWTAAGPYVFDVPGSPSLLLQFDPQGAGSPSRLIDVSGAQPDLIAERSGFGSADTPMPPVAIDAANGLLYDSFGLEFTLEDLAPTGRSFDLSGPVAFTPAMGGVLAGGIAVVLIDRGASHFESWYGYDVGLSPDGRTHYSLVETSLQVTDLAPVISRPEPARVRSGETLVVDGFGLGVVDAVSIAGTEVDDLDDEVWTVTVDLDGVPPGDQTLRITTPWGTAETAVEVLPPLADPFATWDAFVAQQNRDFIGAAGSAASRAPQVTALTNASVSPEEHIEALVASPWYGGAAAPAARLYGAYFGRIPDHGGLTYWANRRRSGTPLIAISSAFASSSEFRRVYGPLGDGAFVDLVYANVLGRAPDPSGRSFWVARLRQGMPRGQVMVSFSESSEHVRTTKPEVDALLVVNGMLRRAPTAGELERWSALSMAGLIREILSSDAYAARVGGPA